MNGRPLDVERHFARAPLRVGLVVVDGTRQPVGLLVFDERRLHAGACRACELAPHHETRHYPDSWLVVDSRTGEIVRTGEIGAHPIWTRYDVATLAALARDLRDHLAADHGVHSLTLDLRSARVDPGTLDRIARQVRAGWDTRAAA